MNLHKRKELRLTSTKCYLSLRVKVESRTKHFSDWKGIPASHTAWSKRFNCWCLVYDRLNHIELKILDKHDDRIVCKFPMVRCSYNLGNWIAHVGWCLRAHFWGVFTQSFLMISLNKTGTFANNSTILSPEFISQE